MRGCIHEAPIEKEYLVVQICSYVLTEFVEFVYDGSLLRTERDDDL